MALAAASMTLAGVGMFMSPRWKGYTVLPLAAKAAASADTAKAVSVPRRAIRSANFMGAPLGRGLVWAVGSAGKKIRKLCCSSQMIFDFFMISSKTGGFLSENLKI